MTNDFHNLHDKATRYETLTAEEETELATWYARLDQEEGELLTLSSKPPTLNVLRNEVDNALTRLEVAARQVKAQAEENDTLRRDIAVLTQQLAQTKTLQAA